jgi:hypothetical protein
MLADEMARHAQSGFKLSKMNVGGDTVQANIDQVHKVLEALPAGKPSTAIPCPMIRVRASLCQAMRFRQPIQPAMTSLPNRRAKRRRSETQQWRER